MSDIRDFARYFCAMALGSEPDADLKLAFHDLRELKVDVAYPFLLELYHDYKADALSKADLLASCATGRGLCLPPCHLRYPHQLDEQDVCHVHQGAEEGSLLREYSGALPGASVISPISAPMKSSVAICKPAISTISAVAATGCAA